MKADLAALGEALPAAPITLGKLTDYAMDLRYEGTSQLPPLDRQACHDAVTILRAHVIARIQAINPSPIPPAATP